VHYWCDFLSQYDRRPAVFTDDKAAKAAALLHVIDGRNVAFKLVEYNDGGLTESVALAPQGSNLFWWLPQETWQQLQKPMVRHDVVSSDLDDRYEFGSAEKLRSLISPWGMLAALDDIEDCRVIPRTFRLPMPTWQRRAQGWYELKSAYGNLVVRRHFGWVIEKNYAALCYLRGGSKVVCDKLQDAFTLALLLAPSADRGLYWRRPGEAPVLTRDGQIVQKAA
jgi:hypothetical protein